MLTYCPLPLRRRLFLLLPALALNISMGQLAVWAGLPLYLDLIGTVALGVACGPILGMLSGGASLLLWNLFTPGMWVWTPVAMSIGLMAGWCARWRLFIAPAFTILAGFCLALTATATSVPIRLMIVPPVEVGEILFSTPLINAGKEVFAAVLSSSFLVEMVDKVTVCLTAWLLLRLAPASWLERLSPALKGTPGLYHPPVSSVIIGYLALLVLYSTFFVTMIVPEQEGALSAAHTAFQNLSPLFQQAFVLLGHYGHWAALALVALLFLTMLRDS